MKPPIIIGGNPRSGTTTVAGLLHAHENILVTSEINPEAAEMACAMMRKLTIYMERDGSRSRIWRRNRAKLMVQIWRSVTSPVLLRGKQAGSWIAHKTPGAEELFEEYAQIFAPARPKLIYCLRNGLLVLRSLLNMPWRSVPFEVRVRDYEHSVRTFEKLREKHTDCVHLFQIDKVPRDPGGRARRVGELFAFLEVDMDDGVREFAERWPAKNTMADLRSDSEVKELSTAQIQSLSSHEEFMRIFREYGYAGDPDPFDGIGGVAEGRTRVELAGLEFREDEDGSVSTWDFEADHPRCSTRPVSPNKIRALCAMEEGERYYLSHGGTSLSDPPSDANLWRFDGDGDHELHVSLEPISGAPAVQLWVIQYDAHKRIADSHTTLRKGANVLRFSRSGEARTLRIALRFSRRGEVLVGPFDLFRIRGQVVQ